MLLLAVLESGSEKLEIFQSNTDFTVEVLTNGKWLFKVS